MMLRVPNCSVQNPDLRGPVGQVGRFVCGKITRDQGREFTAEFEEMADRHDADCRVIATEAPWQNGRCQRHGAVLASIVDASVEQLNMVRSTSRYGLKRGK
eukprot:16442854-Heterocapsa_arctica.AAC.1